jgi:hypothetical protein
MMDQIKIREEVFFEERVRETKRKRKCEVAEIKWKKDK